MSVEDIDDSCFDEEIPPVQGSIILHMVKQARPGMSLARVTFPAFINETRSIVERFSDWCRVGLDLREMNDQEDPAMRMLTSLIWLCDGLHLSPKTPKVPYNSLRGETTRALLADDEGKICGSYYSELMLHPPPIAAFHYKDKDGGIRIYGHIEMVSKFLGNSIVAYMDKDHSRLTIHNVKYDEDYDMNSPNIYGRGILIGKLAMEIAGVTNAKCEKTGISAKMTFDEKPLFWGRYNCVHGTIFEEATGTELIKFEGRWSAYLKAKDLRTGKEWICYDVRKQKQTHLVYPKDEEMCSYEARHIWNKLTEHLEAGEINAAQELRVAFNEKQDKEEKWYSENKKEWQNQFFHYSEERKQWIPNNVDDDFMNEPLEMPPKPEVPRIIQEAIDLGISKTIDEVINDTEAMIVEKGIK